MNWVGARLQLPRAFAFQFAVPEVSGVSGGRFAFIRQEAIASQTGGKPCRLNTTWKDMGFSATETGITGLNCCQYMAKRREIPRLTEGPQDDYLEGFEGV